MAGIYIHIPFCKQACSYCDFHFSTNLRQRGDIAKAIIKELEIRKDELHPYQGVSTLYFGGGTPSLLLQGELQSIIEAVNKNYILASNAEITLEANPDDLTMTTCSKLYDSGINRLSIGIQSFYDEDLNYMNRAHDAKDGLKAVENAQKAKITNISIDLIYGLPNLGAERWKKNLKFAVKTGVQHISSYGLTVEPKTLLQHWIKTQKATAPDEAQMAEEFSIMKEYLESEGFEHYEISNFAKKGYRSRHNSAYWNGTDFLGIGPSAHSYTNKTRKVNVSSNGKYIKLLSDDKLAYTEEVLSPKNKYNEYILTRLRTKEGIKLEDFYNKFEPEIQKHFKNRLNTFQKDWYDYDGTSLSLTTKGMLFADAAALHFFM